MQSGHGEREWMVIAGRTDVAGVFKMKFIQSEVLSLGSLCAPCRSRVAPLVMLKHKLLVKFMGFDEPSSN